MRIGVYSTFWNALKHSFDYKSALDNWSSFSDEISIAVGISEDDTYGALEAYAKERGYPVTLTRTAFDFANDPFAYGKTENAALQACTGDVLVQQNGDEKMLVKRERLEEMGQYLHRDLHTRAFWVPTIDLYGTPERCLPYVHKKWYVHGQNLFRGPARHGIKPDGRPNYDLTSTDELVSITGDLVPAVTILQDYSLSALKPYVDAGWPLVLHCGYLSFGERLSRSLWWKSFWERATNGDKNTHPTTIEEMAAKESVEHGLPLWPTMPDLTPQDFHDTEWPKP